MLSPPPRASLASSTEVVAKRSLLKFLRTPQLLWTCTIQGVMFLVIFSCIFGGAVGTAGLGYVVVFGFVFVWVFMATGLYAQNAQAAQGLALTLVPFTFVSSAYVPAASMPSWLRPVTANQPVTYMIEAAGRRTGGARAEALLGHPAGCFVVRALLWSAVILLVFGSMAVARYRRG